MKKFFLIRAAGLAVIISATPVSAQVPASAGTYSQNFDSLANSGTGNAWTDNVTLPGWYAATNLTGPKTGVVAFYNAGTGTGAGGALYSFGDSASTERALGSLASGGLGNLAYGICFTNDTAFAQTNFIVSYTGEEWRVAGVAVQKLAFSYRIGFSITNADAASIQTWTSFPALDFNSPNTNAMQTLKGNDPTNQVVFTNVVISGIAVQPGQEIFFRWYDADDNGSDDGLAIDNLTISFSPTVADTNTTAPAQPEGAITLMTYNVKGNGSTDWSTNAVQVQAIGRELLYLHPDIITFNEIPYTNTYQMAKWVTAFMPGYFLATNSVTDGSIRSVIASRFPINRSQSWLPHADLAPFGYTNSNFTRDLFEAEINVPNWPLPLHVFTTHLKSDSGTTYADAAAKRAAETAAITNFFATNLFALYPAHPFTLSGDMNDSDTNTIAIQQLISAPTTLRLTNPTNPFTGSINSYSTASANPSERIDFIFPCALLSSNIIGGQVFRTGLLNPPPQNLLGDDDKTASDHLPVLLVFNNPFDTPFQLLAITRTNQSVTLQWESQNNRNYSIEASSDLITWFLFATNIITTTTNSSCTFTTNNIADEIKFFRIHRVP